MANKEHDQLIMRIQYGIDYTRQQLHDNKAIMQTTRFQLRLASPYSAYPSKPLKLLQQAHQSGYATQIYASPTHECYEMGIPKPNWVSEGAVAVSRIHDPQWWAGKSAAAVKARDGPHADADGVKEAAKMLKRVATTEQNRTWKTKRQMKVDQKLAEGLRRQRLGLKMCGSDDDIASEDDDNKDDGGDGDKAKTFKTTYEAYYDERAPEDDSESDDVPSPPQQKRVRRDTALSSVPPQILSSRFEDSREKKAR